jgi:hypothetical protein
VGDVLAPVGLKRAAALVEFVAVELRDQVVLGPEAVDQAPVDEDVGLRLGEAMVADEFKEAAFELRLSPGRLIVEVVSRCSKGGSARATSAARQESIERAVVQ